MVVADTECLFLSDTVYVFSVGNSRSCMADSCHSDKVERDEERGVSFLLPSLRFRSLTQLVSTA